MSVLGEVFDGLQSMSMAQLLLAFVASGAYLLAQGALVTGPARPFVWLVSAASAAAFTLLSADWVVSVMLAAAAIAALGMFAAFAWCLSRLVGLDHAAADDPASAPSLALEPEAAGADRPLPARIAARPPLART